MTFYTNSRNEENNTYPSSKQYRHHFFILFFGSTFRNTLRHPLSGIDTVLTNNVVCVKEVKVIAMDMLIKANSIKIAYN